MAQSFQFLFPDGYIYRAKIDPTSSLSNTITELRAAIFNEDIEEYDNSVQEIKFFYSGVFLNNEFTFNQIKYSNNTPLKVYIKPTPEAIKAKSLHYPKLKSSGFSRKDYSDDEKEEMVINEENKIRNSVDMKQLNALKSLSPIDFDESLMILFYLETNQDMKQVEDYFANIPK